MKALKLITKLNHVKSKVKKAARSNNECLGVICGIVEHMGKRYAGHDVTIFDIQLGGGSLLELEVLNPEDVKVKGPSPRTFYHVKTDADGIFCFAFTWPGSSMGEALMSTTAQLYASGNAGISGTIVPYTRLQIRSAPDLTRLSMGKRDLLHLINHTLQGVRMVLVGYREFYFTSETGGLYVD